MGATSGTYLVGFYLPGDVTGAGSVTKADIQTIKKDHGVSATSSKYVFDADVNRDGRIGQIDIAYVLQNMGVSTSITPSGLPIAPAFPTHHEPSGCTQANTPSATASKTGPSCLFTRHSRFLRKL